MPKLTKEFRMWFDVPDDPDQGRVEIRHLLGGEVQEIIAGSTELRTLYRNGEAQRESRHDLVQDTKRTLSRSIAAWENFKDEAGEQLPCTEANVARYSREDWFVGFIAECRRKTAEAFAEAEKKRLGN